MDIAIKLASDIFQEACKKISPHDVKVLSGWNEFVNVIVFLLDSLFLILTPIIVQRMDYALCQINHYPVYNSIIFIVVIYWIVIYLVQDGAIHLLSN